MMAVSRAMQADDHYSRLARKLGASSAIRPDLIVTKSHFWPKLGASSPLTPAHHHPLAHRNWLDPLLLHCQSTTQNSDVSPARWQELCLLGFTARHEQWTPIRFLASGHGTQEYSKHD